MALIGAHMSIAGGLEKAFFRGQRAKCDVIQIFSRNASRWESRPLADESVKAFKKAQEITSIGAIAVHNSYLINLASSSQKIRRKSFSALLEEVRRAAILGIPYVVIHPGSHVGEGEAKGIKRVVDALKRLHDKTREAPVALLIETTAGQGTNIGYRFEHLAEMINIKSGDDWLGVCLDTCHVFAAGYDFRTKDKYNSMISDFDRVIGIERLKLVHLNDSKKDLGSRVDRHEHLGRGFIGLKAFSFFLRDTRLKNRPFVIETPKGKDENGVDWDVRNIDLLKHMMEKTEKHDCN